MEKKISNGTDLLTVGFLCTADGIWSPMDETVSESIYTERNYTENI